MNTELPRSQKSFGLDVEWEKRRLLTALAELSDRFSEIQKVLEIWKKTNPEPTGRPEYPKYPVMPAYPEAPEYKCQSMVDDADKFVDCIGTWAQVNGRYKQKTGEIESKWKEDIENYEKLVNSYDQRLNDWESRPDVDSWQNSYREIELATATDKGLVVSSWEELNDLYINYSRDLDEVVLPRSIIYECFSDPDCARVEEWGDESETIAKGIELAFLNTSRVILELTEQSLEAATLSCNDNGFYE